jgi:hypothetical protein
MAGTIVADTLTHSTAGSLDTSYVVNGSAKAWVNFNGTSTIVVRDALNVSGLVDNTTGDYTVNFTSSMSNNDYSVSGSCRDDSSSAPTACRWLGISSAATVDTVMTTGLVRVLTVFSNGNPDDSEVACVEINGDLA